MFIGHNQKSARPKKNSEKCNNSQNSRGKSGPLEAATKPIIVDRIPYRRFRPPIFTVQIPKGSDAVLFKQDQKYKLESHQD